MSKHWEPNIGDVSVPSQSQETRRPQCGDPSQRNTCMDSNSEHFSSPYSRTASAAVQRRNVLHEHKLVTQVLPVSSEEAAAPNQKGGFSEYLWMMPGTLSVSGSIPSETKLACSSLTAPRIAARKLSITPLESS